MSFAQANITQSNEKSERPNTATATGVRQCASSQKSFIPKFRSLSQPPSMQSVKETHNVLKKKLSNISVKKSEEAETLPLEPVKNDEFNDCSENKNENLVKSESINKSDESPAQIKSKQVCEKESPKSNTTQPDKKIELKKESNMSRLNSSSFIPVSRSVKQCKPSPKPSPRILTGMSKKPTINQHASESRTGTFLPQTKKTFELFQLKKKKFDLLKKEILEKQKPVLDLYRNLQDLKKKLEENGKLVSLEQMKIMDCEDLIIRGRSNQEMSGASGETSTTSQKIEIDQSLIDSMKSKVKEIPLELVNFCRCLIEKRTDLLMKLEACIDPSAEANTAIISDLGKLKAETTALQSTLEKTFEDQEKLSENLVENWSQYLKSGVANVETEKEKEYQVKIKIQEQELKDLNSELSKTKQLVESYAKVDAAAIEEENKKLKEKISQLEKYVESEKKKQQVENEKHKRTELSLKKFKAQIEGFDASRQQYEARIAQLARNLGHAESEYKKMQKNFEKEIDDLNKARNLDKSTIERLNKDQSAFETRLQTAMENRENYENESLDKEQSYQKEIADLNKSLNLQKEKAKVFQSECDRLQKECKELLAKTEQLSLCKTGKTDLPSDRECALEAEAVHYKTTIKTLEDHIAVYGEERAKLLETIEKMNKSPEKVREIIFRALVKNEELVHKYNQLLKEKETIITQQNVEMDTLHAKVEHLNNQLQMCAIKGDMEMKAILKDGKLRVEQALQKSMKNENKVTELENELTQKNQEITHLENILKLRDGVISLTKAKQEELTMENHSLSRYSEEIRTVILQTKEELKSKTMIIEDLNLAVETKIKELKKYERKVAELEETLAITNQKRYKLQNTVSIMEKELQETKAQIGQIGNMQTRYEMGRISINPSTVNPDIGLKPWRIASESLYKQYKQAYERDVSTSSSNTITDVDTLHMNSDFLQYGVSSLDDDSEITPCKESTLINSSQSESLIFDSSSKNQINSSGVQQFRPFTFGGVDRYEVLDHGEINFSDRGEGAVKIKITVV